MDTLVYTTTYRANDNILSDNIKMTKMNRVKNPLISFFGPSDNKVDSYWKAHVYDLYEYGRIIDTESFVSRAFSKKRSLMFKNGYSLASDNEKNAEYIAKRINEISYVSKLPFDLFLKETAQNLIAFHNAYIVKVRKKEASSGRVREVNGKEYEPIAAYFNLPPETIEVKVDASGTPIYYRQYVGPGRYREYNAEDIIHIWYNKRTGFVMGTPPLEPVKDDILALRRIEESIETLIYKSLFPIIHVKVGTDKNPAKRYPDGTSEVSNATQYLKNIEDNGGLVTSERVEVKAVGAESLALRVEGYLNHFKSRVFIGLGMSAIDFGEGDSTGRATGEVLSESLKESVMDYQSALAEFISHSIFKELLTESGRYKYEYEIPEEDIVWLSFGTLDIVGKLKIESHELNKMTQGVQSINETRKSIGKKSLPDSEIKKMQELQGKGSQQDPNKAGASSKKAKGSSNQTKSVTKPKNQYSDSSTESRICDILDSTSSMKHNRVYSALSEEIKSLTGDEGIIDNILAHDLIVEATANILDRSEYLSENDLKQYVSVAIIGILQEFA